MAAPQSQTDDFFTKMGPDEAENLHQNRPYFLLPLTTIADIRTGASPREKRYHPNPGDLLKNAREEAVVRIAKYAESQPKDHPLTDVYILSHGWHRNFYSAVAAYDRLVSRVSVLLARDKLPLPGVAEQYNPLFITLHWNSEIGADGWVDLSGRRDRVSFLEKSSQYWDENNLDFLNVFEQIFELFSALCAPDTDATANSLVAKSVVLRTKLVGQPMRGCMSRLLPAQRVALVWKCYHESTATGVHIPQQVPAVPFADQRLKFQIVVNFLLGAVGLLVLISRGYGLLKSLLVSYLKPFLASLLKPLLAPILNRVESWWPTGFHWAVMFTVCAIALVALSIPSLLALSAMSMASRKAREKGENYGLGWGALIFYGIAQIVCAAPALIVVVLLYLLPKWFSKKAGLFPERTTKSVNAGNKGWVEWLCVWARFPIRLMNGALEPDSLIKSVSTMVDSQLAFYQMQNRGVDAGEEAAGIVHGLFQRDCIRGARLHMLGHSFGGLLMANMARRLAQLGDCPIYSLTFIEGAFASGWLEKELETVKNVTRNLSSFFSGYDSATGFYYPLTNAARLSAGSVGLSKVPDPTGNGLLENFTPTRNQPYCPFNCTENHIHRPLPFASLADPPLLPGNPDKPCIYNLDASRMVYAGSTLSGGAHTDIYKDDVINLLWAAAHR